MRAYSVNRGVAENSDGTGLSKKVKKGIDMRGEYDLVF